MLDLYYKYNPSPSQIIAQKGVIVENSYFVADGTIYLSNGREFACEFEVAHMQDGSSYAVVYLLFPQDLPIHEMHTFQEQVTRQAKRLAGIDRFWQKKLDVSIRVCVGWKGWEFAPGLRFIFAVWRYEFIADDDLSTKRTDFFLANLPMPLPYTPDTTSELYIVESLNQAWETGVRAAAEKVLHLSLDSATSDEIREASLQEAQRAKEDYLANAPPAYWKYIPIEVGGQIVGRLFWQKNLADRHYPGQPLSILSVNGDKLPPGWTAEGFAEWTCALFSLAIGGVITWNYYRTALKERNQLPSKQVWISRIAQQSRFFALTEERNIHTTLDVGILPDEQPLKLVTTVLAHLFERPLSEFDDYLNALDLYIQYAASPSVGDEFRCTLLCALGEYLIGLWKKCEKRKFKSTIKSSTRKKVLNSIQTVIENNLSELLPIREGESIDVYKTRCDDLFKQIRETVGKKLGSSTLTDELKWFFEQHDWHVNTDLPGDHMGQRIIQFVRSRNKLFHEHRFENEEPIHQYREVRIIEMIIPLMLATILRYEGRYWDLFENRWAWMPH